MSKSESEMFFLNTKLSDFSHLNKKIVKHCFYLLVLFVSQQVSNVRRSEFGCSGTLGSWENNICDRLILLFRVYENCQ